MAAAQWGRSQRPAPPSPKLVTGPAGSGKTTLLAEAASLAAGGGIRVFCSGGDPAARAVPLGAILDALVSTDDPPVDPARLHEVSQSPDQRFWLLRGLQESLGKAAHRAAPAVVRRITHPGHPRHSESGPRLIT